MSYQAVSWVLRHSPTRGAERLVMIVLAEHVNGDGATCWPSLTTIAKLAAIDKRRAERVLTKLEDGGHIQRDRGKGGSSTHYEIIFEAIEAEIGAPNRGTETPVRPIPVENNRGTETPVTGVQRPLGRGTGAPVTGVRVPPEPEVNHNLTTREAEAEPEIPAAAASPPRFLDAIQAERVYTRVTGFVSVPARERDQVIRIISDIWERHRDKTVPYLAEYWAKWRKTRDKQGRFYSPLNPGWLDWAVAGFTPAGAGEKPPLMDVVVDQEIVDQIRQRKAVKDAAHKLVAGTS